MIDNQQLLQILDQAVLVAEQLDGVNLTEDGKNNAANRAINNALLKLSDDLEFASVLAKRQWWAQKGVT